MELFLSGVAPGIFQRGANSSDEGAKIWLSGYYKCKKSPKKSLFTFRRGASMLRRGAVAPYPSPGAILILFYSQVYNNTEYRRLEHSVKSYYEVWSGKCMERYGLGKDYFTTVLHSVGYFHRNPIFTRLFNSLFAKQCAILCCALLHSAYIVCEIRVETHKNKETHGGGTHLHSCLFKYLET